MANPAVSTAAAHACSSWAPVPPLAPSAPSSSPSRYTGTAPVCGTYRPPVMADSAPAKLGIGSIFCFCESLGAPYAAAVGWQCLVSNAW